MSQFQDEKKKSSKDDYQKLFPFLDSSEKSKSFKTKLKEL